MFRDREYSGELVFGGPTLTLHFNLLLMKNNKIIMLNTVDKGDMIYLFGIMNDTIKEQHS